VFVALADLPHLSNGKLDRGALPAPIAPRGEDRIAPRTPTEATLARIWADVLDLAQVSVDANFFALGGDSIVSIQVVSRARQAGLGVTVKQLFQHQTIAELASVATPALRPSADQGAIIGPVPLTPIQRWFFAAQPALPHHFNQSVVIEAAVRLDPTLLAAALRHVGGHHDMLRARFCGAVQDITADLDPILLVTESVADPRALEASAARW